MLSLADSSFSWIKCSTDNGLLASIGVASTYVWALVSAVMVIQRFLNHTRATLGRAFSNAFLARQVRENILLVGLIFEKAIDME